jgi:hypothetical protein
MIIKSQLARKIITRNLCVDNFYALMLIFSDDVVTQAAALYRYALFYFLAHIILTATPF